MTKRRYKLLNITLEANDYTVTGSHDSERRNGFGSIAPAWCCVVRFRGCRWKWARGVEHLREWYTNPVIILSGTKQWRRYCKALDHGANDSEKTIPHGRVGGRIRSALRQTSTDENNPQGTFGDLSIDYAARGEKNNVIIKLTATEYSLLALMARNENESAHASIFVESSMGPIVQKWIAMPREYS